MVFFSSLLAAKEDQDGPPAPRRSYDPWSCSNCHRVPPCFVTPPECEIPGAIKPCKHTWNEISKLLFFVSFFSAGLCSFLFASDWQDLSSRTGSGHGLPRIILFRTTFFVILAARPSEITLEGPWVRGKMKVVLVGLWVLPFGPFFVYPPVALRTSRVLMACCFFVPFSTLTTLTQYEHHLLGVDSKCKFNHVVSVGGLPGIAGE